LLPRRYSHARRQMDKENGSLKQAEAVPARKERIVID
jgi:hypothetical protein